MWTISNKQMEAITESLVKKADEIKEYAVSKETTTVNNMAKSDSQSSTSADNQQAAESSSANDGTNSTWATEPVLPCEQVEVVNITVGTVTPKADPEILSAVWRKNSGDKDKISILKHEEKCFIEVKTQGFDDDDELTLEIKENLDNATTLKTIHLKIKNNEAQTESEDDKALAADENWHGKQLIVQITSDKTELFNGKLVNVVCCEHAIKLGDEGNLIKELNIKLAGFGENGNTVPSKKFTKETENAVKQFQRDYMKVAQTGIVCKQFLEKLDEFCENYYYKIDTESSFSVKCPCLTTTNDKGSNHKCEDGFGKGRASLSSPQKDGPEKPGIHRSLLWSISSMKFYLEKIETSSGITLTQFYSSYRCIADNIRQGRNSTNHMGNAIDIHVTDNTKANCDKIRELFAIYCGAHYRWTAAKNRFCLEPSIASYYDVDIEKKKDPNDPKKMIEEEKDGSDEFTATTWVHIDCREFSKTTIQNFCEDEFYCKSETALKGTSFIEGKLVETSDSEKHKEIMNCSYIAVEKKERKREEILWLGIIQDAYVLEFKNGQKDEEKKWKVKCSSKPKKYNKGYDSKNSVHVDSRNNLSKPRIQEVVEILSETSAQYKIKPRGHSNEGWIDKKYIKQICKHEQSQ